MYTLSFTRCYDSAQVIVTHVSKQRGHHESIHSHKQQMYADHRQTSVHVLPAHSSK